MIFCRTFRNTALKEIGKNYTVQGGKFLLSSPPPPPPYACDQLKASAPHTPTHGLLKAPAPHNTICLYIYIFVLFFCFLFHHLAVRISLTFHIFPHNTCASCWLGTARQFSHDMRGEGGSGVTLICVLVSSI